MERRLRRGWFVLPVIAIVIGVALWVPRSGPDEELPRCGQGRFDSVGFDYPVRARGRPLMTAIEHSFEDLTDPRIDLSASDIAATKLDSRTFSVIVGHPERGTTPFEVRVSHRPGGYLVESVSCSLEV